jgi:hypothetical protein
MGTGCFGVKSGIFGVHFVLAGVFLVVNRVLLDAAKMANHWGVIRLAGFDPSENAIFYFLLVLPVKEFSKKNSELASLSDINTVCGFGRN